MRITKKAIVNLKRKSLSFRHERDFGCFLVTSFALVLQGCSGCANQIAQEVYSPNHKLKLVIFVRDCGATTGFSTQVSLLEASKELSSGKGNLFIADDNHGVAATGQKNDIGLTIKWSSNDHATLTLSRNARVFVHEKSRSGVQISYQVME